MAAAALRQAFLQPDRAQASAMLRHVADQLRQKWPKLAAFIDDSETEVPSYLDFPEQHRSKLHSTNPLERLNKTAQIHSSGSTKKSSAAPMSSASFPTKPRSSG
jgi:transposase-like protein